MLLVLANKMNHCIHSLRLLLRTCPQNKSCLFQQQICRTLAVYPSTDLPVITLPHKTYARIQKLKQRRAAELRSKNITFKSPLLIDCKRNNFNHHKGQTYSDFGPQSLASYGWKHSKSSGDYFTLLTHGENPAVISNEPKSFEDLPLDEDIVRVCEVLGFSTPTSVQNAGIPAILRGESTMCAAETGSGKTLAYLLPALHMLLQRKRNRREVDESLNTPSVIILAPTRELVDQVTEVAERFQEYLDFTMHSVCGGRGTKAKIAWSIDQPMDILISTPGVLRKLLVADRINSSGLQQIILDEADTLLDDSFYDIIYRVLWRLKIPTLQKNGAGELMGQDTGFLTGVQFVLVSATMPRDMSNMEDYIPVDSLRKVTTSGLHRLMPHVPQTFMRYLPTLKPEKLVKVVKKDSEQYGKTMVFCNSSSTSFYLGHLLEENGVQPSLINGEMTEEKRRFFFEKFQKGYCDVLVSTDLASRGLDTVGVSHVINYDFPPFVSDYIHRAGRVGRVGSHHIGLVTSFIAHKHEVETLWKIETAARKSTELHNVNANIKRKLVAEYARRHGITPEDL